MPPNFSPEYIAELKQLSRQRGKYFAIARLRQEHALSLFEADRLMTQWDKEGGLPIQPPPLDGLVSGESDRPTRGAERDAALRAIVAPFVEAGRKIEAIKRVREETGWDLKTAKDFVEEVAGGPGSGPAFDPAALVALVAPALRNRNKIEAIKIVRERTSIGLKEAKDYVEALAEALERGETPPPLVPPTWSAAAAPPSPPPLPSALAPEPPAELPPTKQPHHEARPSLLDTPPAASIINDPPKPSWMTASPQDSTFKPAAIYQSKSHLDGELPKSPSHAPSAPILDAPTTPQPIETGAPPDEAPTEGGVPTTQERIREWYQHHQAATGHRSISEPPARKGCLVMLALGGAAIMGAVVAAAVIWGA